MTQGHSAPYNPNSSICEVCNSSLSYFDYMRTKELGYSVCHSFDCKQIMSQKSTMAPLLFKSHLDFSKKLLHQRRETENARKKHIQKVTAKERKEHSRIFQSVLKKNPELSRQNTKLLVIPSAKSSLTPPSDERVESYIEHLKSIVAEASEYSNASEVIYDEHHDAHRKRLLVDQRFSENPELHTLSDKLCCICKGGCCASGKEHAYLSVFSIRRYMDDNQELTATEIIDLYLARISIETIEDSCINHTSTGCALPRHLRSDICNGYYCESLKSYQKKMGGTQKPGWVVAVQRNSTYWNRFEPDVYNEIINVALIEAESSSDKISTKKEL